MKNHEDTGDNATKNFTIRPETDGPSDALNGEFSKAQSDESFEVAAWPPAFDGAVGSSPDNIKDRADALMGLKK